MTEDGVDGEGGEKDLDMHSHCRRHSYMHRRRRRRPLFSYSGDIGSTQLCFCRHADVVSSVHRLHWGPGSWRDTWLALRPLPIVSESLRERERERKPTQSTQNAPNSICPPRWSRPEAKREVTGDTLFTRTHSLPHHVKGSCSIHLSYQPI